MDTHLIQKFERIGARAKLNIIPDRWERNWRRPPNLFRARFSIDIQHDTKGSYFEIQLPETNTPELEVLDVQRDMRHLLLMARQNGHKDKFLCGHDERHWFTCAVPGDYVSNVRGAMDALRPDAVRNSPAFNELKAKDRLGRRNAAFVRQGEWFFVSEADLIVPDKLILRKEPISRGRGKPHWLEEAYRTGGELVYVCPQKPQGLMLSQYQAVLQHNPNAKYWNWQQMRRNAIVYARGGVSHPDHATIDLRGWHRVVMNTEGDARAARNIVFLD